MRYVVACCFGYLAGVFRGCCFAFLGHMSFQEKACFDEYAYLMRMTARFFPKVRNVSASPNRCRRFKILKGLLISVVDLFACS